MSQTTLKFQFDIDGTPVDLDSPPTIQDSTGLIGVRRVDTGQNVVAPGVTMTRTATGEYEYGPFADPAPNLLYQWTVKFIYGGSTDYAPFTTAGGSDSAAYSSPAQAQPYFASRLFSQPWFNASVTLQQNALTQATTLINKFNYVGRKTDPTQVNEWPRRYVILDGVILDSTAVPNHILLAQFEIAIALLRGYDPEREIRDLRIASRGIAGVRATYDSRHVPDHLLNGIPSKLAWDYLSPYFNRNNSTNVSLRRVS